MRSMIGDTDKDIDDKDDDGDDNDERVKNNVKGYKMERRVEDTLGASAPNSGKNKKTEMLRNGNISYVSNDNSNRNSTHTKQLFYDDDSTTTTVVSLLESSSSTAAAAAMMLPNSNKIGTSIQHRKPNREAKQRLDVQNFWEGQTSTQGLRGEQHEVIEEVHYRRQYHRLDTRIERSIQFLQHPSISSLPSIEKDSYLCSKGLSNDEIKIAKETATMRFPVTTRTTNDPDNNDTDDDNDSDTINSDDYLDLSRRNVNYRRAVKKGENTTGGSGVHIPLSALCRDSVVDNYNDRALIETLKMERRRGIDISIMRQQQPQPMSCIPSPQDKEGQDQYKANTRELSPYNNDGYNHDYHPRNACKLITVRAVVFGVVVVVITMFCQLKNGDNYFLFLPSTPTSVTRATIPKNIDNHLHAGFNDENDKQQDIHSHICRTWKSMLKTPFLAWKLLYQEIDHGNETLEKDAKFNGYSSDKISHIEAARQYIGDMDEDSGDGSCRFDNKVPREERSAFQSNIENADVSFQPRKFTKSINNYSSIHERVSTLPFTQKVNSKVGSNINLWNQGTTYQTVDGGKEVKGSHYPTSKNGQNSFSDLAILVQLSEINSSLNSVKGEITQHRCSNDIYHEESKGGTYAKGIYKENLPVTCNGDSNVFNNLEKIRITLSAIESKLIIAIKDRGIPNIGKRRCQSQSVLDLHKETLRRQAGHPSEKTNTSEYRKTLIPELLKKTFQMVVRIVSKIRVGLKVILNIS